MNLNHLTYALRVLGHRCLKAAKLAQTPRWRSAMRQGVAATIEHDRLPLDLNYNTVIDVGANRGQFTLYARERFPQAMIYSIEPLSGPRSSIQRLFAGDRQVEVLGFAAGAEAGRAAINVTRRDDSSSLLAPTELQTRRFPGTNAESTETVTVRSLDEALGSVEFVRPVLLKIDVQGFELEVLKGAREVMSQVDAVLAECSFVEFYEGQALFDDVYALLIAEGFHLSGGAVSATIGRTWAQGDFVFTRLA